jgi:hypothetical protein
MAFRIGDDCEKWWQHLKKEGVFKTQFDRYYLCLMAGLAVGRTTQLGPSSEFVKNFVDDYKGAQLSLLAMLIYADAKNHGVSVSDREVARNFLNDYLDPTDPSRLSAKGFTRLNEYAAGGFVFIREHFPEQPYQFLPFIERYTKLIREHMPKSYPEAIESR